MKFDVMKVRAEFPALTQKVRGKPLVYLDSAASALKPWPVIERISQFYSYEAANVHRGAHYLADQGTQHFEEAREKVRAFLGADSTEEIIFTKGTTESLNLVAESAGRVLLRSDDEVLISQMEHHANIVPWQLICQKMGAKLKVFKVTDKGEVDMEDFAKKLSERTKILAVTHASNTLGTVIDIKSLVMRARAVGAVIVVDGAQRVANAAVDVKDLDVDFYAFSGHKIFGPYGIGVLYGKKKWLLEMPPYQGGGSMISTVTFEKTTYNDLPFKFEAGTPHIEGVIGLGAAIDYVHKWGFSGIHEHEQKILNLATEKLKEIPDLRIIGEARDKAPIISFSLKGLHPSDIGQILDQEGIAVRVGHHCTQPLLERFGVTGTVRASFSIFNTEKDVEALVKSVLKAKEMLS